MGRKRVKLLIHALSIQFFYIHIYYVYGWWLTSRRGSQLTRGGGQVPSPHPSLSETILCLYSSVTEVTKSEMLR